MKDKNTMYEALPDLHEVQIKYIASFWPDGSIIKFIASGTGKRSTNWLAKTLLTVRGKLGLGYSALTY